MTSSLACASLLPCLEPDETPIQDAVVAWDDEVIVYAGPRSGFPGEPDRTLPHATVVPGFVDCHTHLPFVGWRDDEFEARLAGRSYRDLHGEGGIARSARMFAEAADEEVLSFARGLAFEMLAHGTTALELKTGYGLSVEAELRQARLARRLAAEIPQVATVTLLACHAVPEGWEREAWVTAACTELIPAAADEGLADAVDVYVEDIAFSVEDLHRVAEAAFSHGLRLRVHADQLGASGAAEAAAELGAASADHLNHVSGSGVTALARSGTTAVLLPASTFLLRARPPRPELLSGGVSLAIATDCNPGTSPVASMPLALAIACVAYGLSPARAVHAATAGGAEVLGVADRLGSLRPGFRADLVVLEGDDVRMLAYRPDHDPVLEVVVAGRVAWSRPAATA